MSPTSFPVLKKLVQLAALSSAVVTSIHIYDVKTSPSKFELAATHLGFSIEKQKAILKIDTMAGYFKPQKMWDDVYRSKIFGSNAENVFSNVLYPVVHKAYADKADMKILNDSYLQNNLFGRSKNYFWETKDNGVEIAQVEKWILYQAQNAFARHKDSERHELQSQNWMEEYKGEFFDAAQTLELIDRIKPHQEKYDQAWIAGASRPRVMARVIDYVWTSKHGIEIKGDVKILAGARELWAEIDGMSPNALKNLEECFANGQNIDDSEILVLAQSNAERIEDGARYMISLAQKHGIELVEGAPVIKYSTKAECPAGRFPGRTYLNYKNADIKKVDESLMSLDLLNQFGVHGVKVVDTLASENLQRPTTESTARDSAMSIIENIKNGHYGDTKAFNILFESNNPYILRQGLSAQWAVNEELKKAGLYEKGYRIELDNVGFKNTQDVANVFSEFGAYGYELYKSHIGEPDKTLTYQGRDHSMDIPEMPVIGDVEN